MAIFSLFGIISVLFLVYIGYNSIFKYNDIDTSPIISAPFNMEQKYFTYSIDNLVIPKDGLFTVRIRLDPKSEEKLNYEKLSNIFYHENSQVIMIKYTLATIRSRDRNHTIYGQNIRNKMIIPELSKQGNNYIFTIHSSFMQKGDHLLLKIENINEISNINEFNSFIEISEEHPSK